MKPRRLPLLLLALGCALPAGRAAAPARELSTDRPDATESPFTVEPGRVQLELDAASYTRNRLDGVRTTEWVVAPFNVRYGLAPAVEAGLFVTPHVHVTEKDRSGAKTIARGLGDTVLRLKLNLRGNDGGPLAFGVFADVKLPTAQDGLGNDQVEGALTFPVAFEVGGGWEGAAMTAVELVHTGASRRAVWVNTLVFGRDLAPDLGCFLELTSRAGDGAHVATFNCGLTRKLDANTQLDCGLNLGVSRTAPDLGVFAGLSRRW
jgi:hypothetical protein